jgi:hypothetical protein
MDAATAILAGFGLGYLLGILYDTTRTAINRHRHRRYHEGFTEALRSRLIGTTPLMRRGAWRSGWEAGQRSHLLDGLTVTRQDGA